MPREGGLWWAENFWLRLSTASAQCLRLSERFFILNMYTPQQGLLTPRTPSYEGSDVPVSKARLLWCMGVILATPNPNTLPLPTPNPNTLRLLTPNPNTLTLPNPNPNTLTLLYP